MQSQSFQLLYTFLDNLFETGHSRILKCRSNSTGELVAIKIVNLRKIPEFTFSVTHLHSLPFHFYYRHVRHFICVESGLLLELQDCSHIVRYKSQRMSSDNQHLELAMEFAPDGSLLNLVCFIHSLLLHSCILFLPFIILDEASSCR